MSAMAPTLVCREVVALASAFLDGELSDEARDAVEWHLFECRYCPLYLSQLRETVRLVGSYELGSARLDAEVVEQLREAFARSR